MLKIPTYLPIKWITSWLLLATLMSPSHLNAQRSPSPEFTVKPAEAYDFEHPTNGMTNDRWTYIEQSSPFESTLYFTVYRTATSLTYHIEYTSEERFASAPDQLALNIDGQEIILTAKRNESRYSDFKDKLIYSMWFEVDKQFFTDVWLSNAVIGWTPMVNGRRYRTVTVTGQPHRDFTHQLMLVTGDHWLPEPPHKQRFREEELATVISPYTVVTSTAADGSTIRSHQVTVRQDKSPKFIAALTFVAEEQQGQLSYSLIYEGNHQPPYTNKPNGLELGIWGSTRRLYTVRKQDVVITKPTKATKPFSTFWVKVPATRELLEEIVEKPSPFAWAMHKSGMFAVVYDMAIITGNNHNAEAKDHLNQLKRELTALLAATAP